MVKAPQATGMNPWERITIKRKENGKTLIIKKYNDGFTFMLYPSDGNEYTVKYDPNDERVAILSNGIDTWTDTFEDFHVNSICGFFIMLQVDPEEFLEDFFGKRIPIKEVQIEDYSDYPHGFEPCDMWDAVRPWK